MAFTESLAFRLLVIVVVITDGFLTFGFTFGFTALQAMLIDAGAFQSSSSDAQASHLATVYALSNFGTDAAFVLQAVLSALVRNERIAHFGQGAGLIGVFATMLVAFFPDVLSPLLYFSLPLQAIGG